MIPVGQPYRPAGTLDVRSILITTILGVTAAVIGAAVVWAWEWSGIPTLVIITPILQGLGVGLVMAFAIGRLRMRNTRLVALVGFACGLLSIALVHYGHYMHMVALIADQIRGEVAAEKSLPEEKRRAIVEKLDTDPAGFVDRVLVGETGHAGFLGSLYLRNRQGVTLKNTEVTGAFLWGLWAFEALMVAGVASSIAASRASQPFCEDCGYWCEKQPDLFALPSSASDPLVAAIRDDHPAQVASLRANPPQDDGSGQVGVTLHACPACDQSFADVSQRVVKGKETKVTALLALHRVSPEMAEALRNVPASPAEPEPVSEPEPAAEGEEAPTADPS